MAKVGEPEVWLLKVSSPNVSTKKAKKVTAVDLIQQMTSQKYRDCDATEKRMN